MNWKKIETKYPKAFDKFFIWFKGDPEAAMTKKEFLEVNDIIVMHGDIRELYDFFDEQGIYISMWIWYVDDDGKGTDIPVFKPSIGGMGIDMLYPDGYKIRKEAEEVSFLKAFETLENQLNK